MSLTATCSMKSSSDLTETPRHQRFIVILTGTWSQMPSYAGISLAVLRDTHFGVTADTYRGPDLVVRQQ